MDDRVRHSKYAALCIERLTGVGTFVDLQIKSNHVFAQQIEVVSWCKHIKPVSRTAKLLTRTLTAVPEPSRAYAKFKKIAKTIQVHIKTSCREDFQNSGELFDPRSHMLHRLRGTVCHRHSTTLNLTLRLLNETLKHYWCFSERFISDSLSQHLYIMLRLYLSF